MKTIGILGGMGPQATIDFEARLHRESQRLLPQKGNEGYPPVVTVYVRHAPVRVKEDSTPSHPLTLDPRLLDAVRRLGEWADLIASPCNTPHFFLKEISEAAGCEMVSLIDATLPAIDREKKLGLLGLGIPKVWSERLDREGISYVTADEAQRAALDAAIIRLMEGADGEAERRAALDAVRGLRAAGAGQILLGCTEIPLLLGDEAKAKDLVNPSDCLAAAVVRRAVGPGRGAKS